jgi:lactate dehydrogenase-like 2-hydroxyacid dehydrogenase
MEQTRITVTREIAKPALDRLKAYGELTVWKEQEPPPYERLVEMTAGSHGLLCLLTDRIDEPLLAAAPDLRVVSTMSVGYEHIDLPACKKRGIKAGRPHRCHCRFHDGHDTVLGAANS